MTPDALLEIFGVTGLTMKYGFAFFVVLVILLVARIQHLTAKPDPALRIGAWRRYVVVFVSLCRHGI